MIDVFFSLKWENILLSKKFEKNIWMLQVNSNACNLTTVSWQIFINFYQKGIHNDDANYREKNA